MIVKYYEQHDGLFDPCSKGSDQMLEYFYRSRKYTRHNVANKVNDYKETDERKRHSVYRVTCSTYNRGPKCYITLLSANREHSMYLHNQRAPWQTYRNVAD